MDDALPTPRGPPSTPPCQTCSQVGSELLTSLKGNIAPQATHCPLSEALPSPGNRPLPVSTALEPAGLSVSQAPA